MGRSPCCSKEGLNRGAWTSQEDIILSEYIRIHGDGGWRNLPKKAGLKRCGKSCRLRWRNYLRPDIKRGNISPEEEDLIIRLHRLLGNRWALIAGRLPERTDNEIKNYWTTHLSKKLFQSQPNSIKNGFNGYGCSNGNSHDGFKSFNVKETKNSWRSSCDIPVRDSIITYDDSEPIAKEGRNTATCSMSRLVDERSPLFDYDYFADAPTLAESLLDLNELSSPGCNLLSSPSKSCACFGLEEFYTEPATLGGKAIEFEVMCSDEFNMQRVNSFTFGDDEWLQEDLCSSAKLVDWIHELDYIQ